MKRKKRELELDPEGYHSWNTALVALNDTAIALLVRLPDARRQLRTRSSFLERLTALAKKEYDLADIPALLTLCEGDHYVLLFPFYRKGYRLHLEAIRNIGQLLTLLHCALWPQAAALGARSRYGPRVELCKAARGEIEPPQDMLWSPLWRIYTLHALEPDGTFTKDQYSALPASFTPDCAFRSDDGEYVLLAGPQSDGGADSDARWFTRFHPALRADVRVTRELSPQEVDDWLARLRQKQKQKQKQLQLASAS